MKKLKLLSSLSALILTISLVGCNNSIDRSIDDGQSDNTELSVTLSNYTLSFIILDNGKNIDLPWYDTIYIIGSWDGWSDFIPLKEQDGKYITTFDKIKTGTYEFKGLVGLSFDEPSWSFTEIITDDGGNAKFDVLRSDGNNCTKNLSFEIQNPLLVLDESVLSDEEIANIILTRFDTISKDGLNWVAFHGTQYEDDNLVSEAYLSNDNGVSCGKIIENNDVQTIKYLQNGNAYFVDEVGEYQIEDHGNAYQDDLDFYVTDAVTEFSSITSATDFGNYIIIHEDESTYYTLSANDGADVAICRRAGDDFYIFGLEHYEEYESFTSELITQEDVETQMIDFKISDWTDVGQIFRDIEEEDNYTILIEYYEVYSDSYYYTTADELYEEYNSGNLPLYYRDLYVELIYTKDAVLIEYFTSYTNAIIGSPYDVEMFINDYANNRTLLYWYNGSSTFHNSYYYYSGLWQDSMDTLLQLVPYRDNFVIGESTTGGYGLQTVYDFSINDEDFFETLIYTMFYCDNWFVGEYVNGPDAFLSLYEQGFNDTFTCTSVYFNELEEWDVILQTSPVCWTSSYVSWLEQDMMQAAISNVGTSEIPEGFVPFFEEVNG